MKGNPAEALRRGDGAWTLCMDPRDRPAILGTPCSGNTLRSKN